MLAKLFKTVKSFILKDNYSNGYGYGYSWLEYFDNINIVDSHFTSLIKLLKIPTKNDAFLETKKIFKPYDVSFGTSSEVTIAASGNPNYRIDNSSRIAQCEVIFYKKKIGSIKLLTQLHFFENKLFLVKTDFSSSLSTESLNRKIANLTLKKYAEKEVDYKKETIKLMDQHNNHLTIDLLSINPSIIYVSGDKTVTDKIISIIQTKQSIAKSKEKLINDELFKKL